MAKNTILLVDDDENICKVIKLYLEKEGLEIRIANDGKQGLDMFSSYSPDLVLLDIMMPGMDGDVYKRQRPCCGRWTARRRKPWFMAGCPL